VVFESLERVLATRLIFIFIIAAATNPLASKERVRGLFVDCIKPVEVLRGSPNGNASGRWELIREEEIGRAQR
jgi:hypothetical protein